MHPSPPHPATNRSAFVLGCLAVFGAWQSSYACSLALTDERLDTFVFYGEVIAHTESEYRGDPAWGVTLVPRHAFRIPVPKADGLYDIHPMGLAADCRAVPEAQGAQIQQRFPIGSMVAVMGPSTEGTSIPGDIATTGTSLLYPIDGTCDIGALVRSTHDYATFEVACGSYRFEANKDIASLGEASLERRIEILERLAGYRNPLAYRELVGAYVRDAATGRRLLALRYENISDAECAAASQLAPDDGDWERRARVAEFCRQRDPYETL